jgi:DNA invertase Pin-like site-specific DNA recombinase
MGTAAPQATATAGGLTGTGPVPVAFVGRTSTFVVQDPVASMRRQVREVQEHLLPGWFISAWYWDIESGGMDLEYRGHGTAHELFPEIGIPRDGGLADLLAEALAPNPRFAVVMCEDIERSGRDTFNAIKLERDLAACGVPLFATDEPIDIEGISPTTVLIRRVKQGVAEWYRLQIKRKAWQGLREHALSGWNIGKPPYGYAAQRVPHPVAVKAAQGLTKTRLVLDPVRGPVVAQIFRWRVSEKAGISTIVNRLNADHDTCPPPKGDTWTLHGVYALLQNPKYTGYMVWNRYTEGNHNGRRHRRLNPRQQWVWSDEPSHPAIITRELFDAAQAVTYGRDSIVGEPGEPAHPLAQRSYELRSLIRHRACTRRMFGVMRAAGVYYMCPHDMRNARHAAACPDHPTTVTIREDLLATAVRQFFAERIFGPDRINLLADLLPANAEDDTARKERQAAKLRRRLAQIDTAEHAHTQELEALATTSGHVKALAAMRQRHLERFTELETEREQINTELATLTATQAPLISPELLDNLPLLPGILPDLPAKLRRRLYQAFDLQLLYKHETSQVTIRATITTSTPATVAAIIHDSQTLSGAAQAPHSDPAHVPGAPPIP